MAWAAGETLCHAADDRTGACIQNCRARCERRKKRLGLRSHLRVHSFGKIAALREDGSQASMLPYFDDEAVAAANVCIVMLISGVRLCPA